MGFTNTSTIHKLSEFHCPTNYRNEKYHQHFGTIHTLFEISSIPIGDFAFQGVFMLPGRVTRGLTGVLDGLTLQISTINVNKQMHESNQYFRIVREFDHT